MQVKAARLERNIEELAQIGKRGETGVSRLTWSKEDLEGRKYVIGVMREAGLDVREDAAGNIVGRRTRLTSDPGRPVVMIGSHIDTPLVGGKYDGTIGVLGGIEAVRMLDEAGMETHHPIEVVAFAGEELTRFGVSFKGSMGMVGVLTTDLMKSWKDKFNEGKSYYDALAAAGFDPGGHREAIRAAGSIKCYFEMHIEQGRVLEECGKTIGVVSAIAGATRGWATVYGMADHSGATPMAIRKDALTAAAELVLELEAAARREARLGTVATIGDLVVKPGVMNIIPEKVVMSLEVRGIDVESKRRVFHDFHRKVSEVEAARNRRIEYCYSAEDDPVPVPRHMQQSIEQAAQDLGLDYRVMPSGAGHDAMFLARMTDMGMIFVPSVNGVSHVPEEYTRLEDIVAGTRLLAEVVRRAAA